MKNSIKNMKMRNMKIKELKEIIIKIKDFRVGNIEKGQTTIEFILLLPFIIIVFYIFFQLGCCVYIQNNIEQTAREAARIIATTNSNKKASDLVEKNKINVEFGTTSVEFLPENENERELGEYIKVTIKVNYEGFANVLKHFTEKDIVLSSESLMRMECGYQS